METHQSFELGDLSPERRQSLARAAKQLRDNREGVHGGDAIAIPADNCGGSPEKRQEAAHALFQQSRIRPTEQPRDAATIPAENCGSGGGRQAGDAGKDHRSAVSDSSGR